MKEPSSELLNLSRGPQRAAKKYSAHVVNGFRFHTKKRDAKCTTQNSGVILTALTTCFASSKDKNPTIGDVTYFGAIEEIIEVDYWGAITVVYSGVVGMKRIRTVMALHASISLKIFKRMILLF